MTIKVDSYNAQPECYTRHIFNYPRGRVDVFAHESIKHKSDIVALLVQGYE